MSGPITNPVKAIRARCLDCCCGSSTEVRLCAASDCALWPFRFGKNPYYHRRPMTEEEKARNLRNLQGGGKRADQDNSAAI